MYRDKTIIQLRRGLSKGIWKIKRGKRTLVTKIGISRLLRLISTLVQDKGKVYSIDIIIKRKR